MKSWRQICNNSFCILGVFIFFKLIVFDFIWCSYTTFTPFSTIESYTTKAIAAIALLTPYLLFRRWKLQIVVLLLLDFLLIANLMYYRTYYTTIPLSSYTLVSNLSDFTQSVYDSVRWYDIVFPLSTVTIALLFFQNKRYKTKPVAVPWRTTLAIFIVACASFGAITAMNGGFKSAYSQIKYSAHLYASGAPMYTIFGSLYYDFIEQKPAYTPEIQKEIEEWLAKKPKLHPLSSNIEKRTNCIVIFVESLESWILEKTIENQEITPYLNRLLKDSTTLYAPYVLTEVKGGRSIDAQLLLCAGLLPINSGTYSTLYTGNTYYTLEKALKEKRHTHNYLLTVDKKNTWNQELVAQSFGIDTIISYPDFKLTEAFGPRKRVGDVSFLKQCREKIEKGEVWKKNENVYLQFVTYSSHNPFRMPDELKQVSFSSAVPQVMNDYMSVVNYTDRAIGEFVEFLKTMPEYKETLIVITGDHEGLATRRAELCNDPYAKDIVSDKQFTPFIVVNSPVGLRYEKVMGQIDMYPTLLNLLQLDDYYWTGLGQSIFDPNKKGFAVNPQMQVEGEDATPEEIDFNKKAYDISDEIIRFDYFSQKEKEEQLSFYHQPSDCISFSLL